MNRLEITELHSRVTSVRDAVRELLASAEHADCRDLSASLVDDSDEILSVALIGQYNAGKSSIAKALVPSADVVIDANVATDEIVEMNWHGLRVLDTPGLRAGRPSHDDMAEQAIAGADLLLFVVTAELFDATIADYFRSMVIDAARTNECLLVINKSTQDVGDPQTKLAHVAEVFHPLSPDDLRVVFIDARARLWAEDTADSVERAEYLQLSNFDAFTSEIDAFARRAGLRARLTTPAFQTIDTIDRALTALADYDEIEEQLGLLNDRREALLRHRRELDETARAAISGARIDVVHIGQEVAGRVRAEDDEHSLQLVINEGEARADRRVIVLDEELDTLIRAAAQRISNENDGIPPELSAGHAAGGLPAATSSTDVPLRFAGPKEASTLTTAEVRAGLQQISAFFGENARPGQPGHALIYRAGKAVRIKFKPWGAVKMAQRASKVAAGLGAAVVVYEFLRDHQQDLAEQHAASWLQELQQAIRNRFLTYADSVASVAEQDLALYIEGSYNVALAAVDALSEQMLRQHSTAGGLSEALLQHREELSAILDQIQGIELTE